MSQAADAEETNSEKAAAMDESDDDLCEVEFPFAIIDNGSSDDDELEQYQESSRSMNHTEKLHENAIIDCFNFSVNAHIKGEFELTTNNNAKITEADESKGVAGNCNDVKEGRTTEQNPAEESLKTDPANNDRARDWLPASLPLPAWAASD